MSKTRSNLCILFALCTAVTLAGEPNFDTEFPTAKAPWKADQVKTTLETYRKHIETLMALPTAAVTAHPAGSDFPGTVPEGTPHVSATVKIDLSTTGMHSTGLYALPGEKITVTIPATATKSKLEVKIGCHQDQLWKSTEWKRVPQITRKFTLAAEATPAANAFGGPIYIVVNTPQAGESVDVKIENAVAAPWYVLDQTPLDEWKKSIRERPAPFAELQSKHMILSVPSAVVRTLDNPDELMRFWDTLVEAEDRLAAKPSRAGPMRIAFDRQISVGYMHSGYPIMCPLNEAKNAASLDAMKKGTWGFYHEMGHNHQNPDWTFAGTVEVTCNLFSLYCLENVLKVPRDGHPSIKPKAREQKLKNYFKDGGHFEDWKLDPFLALFMYSQLIEQFGWAPFEKVFIEYRDLPAAERPKTDDQKHDQWLIRMSKQTGKNLGPFFEAWKVPTSEAARKQVADLPAWMPSEDFPKKYLDAPKP